MQTALQHHLRGQPGCLASAACKRHSLQRHDRIPSRQRSQSRLRCSAAAVAEPPTWQSIEHSAGSDVLEGFVVRPGQAPGTAPHPVVPTQRMTKAPSKPVLLWRDTNAWCPFCERVWMALLEKNIEFEVMFISLYNKPEWFEEVVPTKLVPAVSIRGRVVWESADILKALDEEFPERPLFPADAQLAEQGAKLSAASDELSAAGYKFLLGREGGFGAGSADESRVPEFQAEFEQHLAVAEAALAQHSDKGPFFLGEFSHVDLMFMPSLERFAANMPRARGFRLKDNPDYPHLSAWFDAMDARPAYQQVKSDDMTHHLVSEKIMQFSKPPHVAPLDDFTQRARREAAAKLNINRKVIVRDCALRSGVFTDVTGVNGYPAEPSRQLMDAVDFALRRMASWLLTGHGGPKHADAHGRAVGAATLSYFRNRASSPRDMSAAAAAEMRRACDAVLQDTY